MERGDISTKRVHTIEIELTPEDVQALLDDRMCIPIKLEDTHRLLELIFEGAKILDEAVVHNSQKAV